MHTHELGMCVGDYSRTLFSKQPEMRYCEICKNMSLLYFGFDLLCQFEARVPEFDAELSVQCALYSPQLFGGGGGAGVACQILGL
jgi:hypothetical protein